MRYAHHSENQLMHRINSHVRLESFSSIITIYIFFLHNHARPIIMLRKILSSPIYRRQLPIRLSSNNTEVEEKISLNTYNEVSDSALEQLSEKLESILEDRYDSGADVSLNNGVLTVTVDNENTFVINKQTPNRQIWLSSPLSGPMRFDFVSGQWVEKYTKTELRNLLSKELSHLLKNQIEC